MLMLIHSRPLTRVFQFLSSNFTTTHNQLTDLLSHSWAQVLEGCKKKKKVGLSQAALEDPHPGYVRTQPGSRSVLSWAMMTSSHEKTEEGLTQGGWKGIRPDRGF